MPRRGRPLPRDGRGRLNARFYTSLDACGGCTVLAAHTFHYGDTTPGYDPNRPDPVGLVLALGVSTGLVAWFGLVPGAVVTALVLVAVFIAVQARGGDSSGEFWAFTSSAEQTGRYAESGGIARAKQEQALRDVEKQADRLDE